MKPKATHRRPHNAAVDGPFPVAPGSQSTRERQMAKTLRTADSGLGPGQYNSHLVETSLHKQVRSPFLPCERELFPMLRNCQTSCSCVPPFGQVTLDATAASDFGSA